MSTTDDHTNSNTSKPKWIFPLGYLLLAVSSILYVIEIFVLRDRRGDNFSVFFVHYFIALGYWIVLLVNKMFGLRKSWNGNNINYTVLLVNLFLVSAFALNRELPVFEESTDWLCLFIILSSATLLSYRFFKLLPKWVNVTQGVLLGLAIMLYLYWSIYVANFYILGSIGGLAIGIGMHIYVPVLLLICAGFLVKYYHTKSINYALGLGCVAGLTVTSVFIFVWHSRISAIEKVTNQAVLNSSDLPSWVMIGQTINNDWVTHRILKSDLVYTVSNENFHWDIFPTDNLWDESKKHDPLVFIASLFRKIPLSHETRIQILQAITDDRHRAQERLWLGDNLTTSYVVSDVDIYPDLRLAYTEKYLNIKNNSTRRRWWGSTEEAIYTFQLPEGSIVTSLSLWIDGKEEKSVLTSKQKADSAYKTIVGKESRDPSVVHWNEGNTVSVRVFPCSEKEERKFKIGITSPLPEKNGRIVYSNISFRGPNPENAKETVRIRFMSEPLQLELPAAFKKNKKGDFQLEQDYNPDLTLSFAPTAIRENYFSFDGFGYSISEYKPNMKQVHIKNIFLDINNTWTKDEIESIRPLLKAHTLFCHVENEMVKLNDDNWNEVTKGLSSQNFSLFPFFLVNDHEQSLVITKGKELSLHLSDVKESAFAHRTSKYFSDKNKTKVFNLGSNSSTYVSTFRELRGLQFANGNTDDLKDLLHRNHFPSSEESPANVVFHEAHLVIQKTAADSSKENNAPDHLARLFAYNDIMRKIGAHYFEENFIDDDIIKEASAAYVVSPVSSLIVLETKEDYDRFGIKDEGNSLLNASKASSGAVPEPQEWMLIILFALLILLVTWRKYNLKSCL